MDDVMKLTWKQFCGEMENECYSLVVIYSMIMLGSLVLFFVCFFLSFFAVCKIGFKKKITFWDFEI